MTNPRCDYGQRALIAIACCFLTAVASAADANGPVPFPSPKYPVRIEKSVLVPMRDGVRLSTDLYLPENAGDRLPVILYRTQYGKARYQGFGDESRPKQLAGQGFVVAVQDIRGRFESEGEYVLAKHDAVDGYDTVDWLARQSWSNGRIGTFGCSSLGITQVLQAQLRHPALTALVPQSAGGATDRQRWDVLTGGVPEIGWALGWFREDGGKLFARPQPGFTREQLLEFTQYFNPKPKLPEIDDAQILASLPVRDMASKAGGPLTDWVDYVTRKPGDPWWQSLPYFREDSRVDVPALHVNSWYDMSVGETLYLYEQFRDKALSKRARDNQFLIISPTDHCNSEFIGHELNVGGRDLGDARKDYWSIYLNWFNHWLRAGKGDFTAMPRVQYYLMGKNEWRSANRWPLPGMRPTKYFLGSAGHANSRNGDGTLATRLRKSAPTDSFVYDPGNAVPSRDVIMPGDNFDQADVESRDDVLVYSTPPLQKGVELTGPIEVVLYVSSSARDTDFTANLVDVYPDGRAFHVRSGIIRARYREGFDREVFMEPDGIYEVRIGLGATSNWFGPDHRIRLQVSSSNFPRFARNLNTGGDNQSETQWVKATNRVHHDLRHSSYVVLPIVP
jgi:uncharacterized protein